MKKIFLALLFSVAFIIGIVIVLNMEVTTQQGINYEWHAVKLPLYLKVLDFFDRHYNYKLLVKRITTNSKTEEEKVMRLFEWTHKNIRKAPPDLPMIDDHVWYIIVRGYGGNDQFSDVFTTLCNYAGADAFYIPVFTEDKTQGAVLSFVRVNKIWRIYDPHNGIYFLNKSGKVATIDEIKNGNWQIASLADLQKKPDDYIKYFANLPTIKGGGLHRENIQSPLNRLIYEIRRWFAPR